VRPAIPAPFFEVGPKTFLDRAELLDVVDAACSASVGHDVAVIITPPALDIEVVKRAAPGLWVFAQSMDVAARGASSGAIIAEALADVGADGVMLNHAERPLAERALRTAIDRARDAGLRTLVCANDSAEAAHFAAWHPDLILLEPHDLIGTAHGRERPWIAQANAAVARVDPRILVMHSGGVAHESDVQAIIAQGAAGTGCTSAIVRATDRRRTVTQLIAAVREGWERRSDQTQARMARDAREAH
jgi:triosephosphate isomerase (TIM)